MKLMKFMKRGPDKLVAGFSLHTATRGQDNHVKTIRIWFSKYINSEATHWVEIDRADANRLRDYLNTMLPEADSVWKGRPFLFPNAKPRFHGVDRGLFDFSGLGAKK